MKMLMVANVREGHKNYSIEQMCTLLRAQIENSIEVGWYPPDIFILANFEFEFMGVRVIRIELNDFCWTGSKCFGIEWLWDHGYHLGQAIWAKDLDVWQNVPFDQPRMWDVGITTYSRPKLNGGSVFWGPGSEDIIDVILTEIRSNKAAKEEPIINRILTSDEYKNRITVLNTTYNVGCSGFVPRYKRAEKPVKACHFHPTNKVAWETHALDRNGLDEGPLTERLEKLVRKYYPGLATELSKKGRKKAEMLRMERLKEEK